MLLYDSDDERNLAAVHYINEGLKGGQLCVYASVGAYDGSSKWHTSKISSKITDYEENVKNGNLIIVDFKPFFESAQQGNLSPFLQLKEQLELLLKQRIADGRGNRMMVFADAACTLSENKEFDKCMVLESWWQGAHKEWLVGQQNITVVCPHPSGVLDIHSRERVGSVHSITLHLKPYKPGQASDYAPLKVLIAESDADMQYLYRRYMGKLGFDVTVVETGSECMNLVNGNARFDTIIIDVHNDMSTLQLAKMIKEGRQNQKVIVTTTSIPQDLYGVDVITKPFSLSKLVALMSPKVVN